MPAEYPCIHFAVLTLTPCTDLPFPSNGDVTYSGGSTNSRDVGVIATFTCDPDYTLNGISTRTCQNGGTWSGLNPTCEGVFVS